MVDCSSCENISYVCKVNCCLHSSASFSARLHSSKSFTARQLADDFLGVMFSHFFREGRDALFFYEIFHIRDFFSEIVMSVQAACSFDEILLFSQRHVEVHELDVVEKLFRPWKAASRLPHILTFFQVLLLENVLDGVFQLYDLDRSRNGLVEIFIDTFSHTAFL